jgi:hypothetical protein
MDLSLETREGLPEAFQVLLREHPRAAWQADPHFNGLIAFWLDRHMMFRKLGTLLQQESEALLDDNTDARRFAQAVGHYGGMFVNQLHGHHQIEDHHYFPVLATRDLRPATSASRRALPYWIRTTMRLTAISTGS